jgi:hypothetical protein
MFAQSGNDDDAIGTRRITVNSYEELMAREEEILARIANVPHGAQLFLIHPLRLFADIGVDLSERAKDELLGREPNLTGLSSLPYDALRSSEEPQSVRFHLHGLFERR